jgi:ABC-2 type transport system ATP-binding protein
VIVAEGVSKYYGARQALFDVSFRIEKGEVVGFLGLNGAGKTTALKILSGALLPSSGSISVDGVDGVAWPREVRRRVGFLPDRPPLYPEMTVRRMLAYAGRLHGVSADRIRGRVDDVLALADLVPYADELVENLSHGYKQRVGIASTIIHEPALVILDEPISGLDPAQIIAMRGLIRGLAAKHTVLLSSHILGEISQTCDRILLLHQGKVVAQGKESELSAGSHAKIEVVARGDLASLQKADPGRIEGVSLLEAAQHSQDAVKITARVAHDAAREELVRSLVAQGFGVRTVVDVEAGLESVFLRLTQQRGEA